jgi:hypothetical protein
MDDGEGDRWDWYWDCSICGVIPHGMSPRPEPWVCGGCTEGEAES